MSDPKLDALVKGAPAPDTSLPAVTAATDQQSTSPERNRIARALKRPQPPLPLSDPLSHLPSSPPQIYLNLIILEASLRSQYLALRNRRRVNTFFLILLTAWASFFFWALFLRQREDGSGLGGSVYWAVEAAEKMALLGGVLTAVLVWATGQWERGVRWPRRWVGVTNRGLRGMNLKIVVLRGPWWKEAFGWIACLVPVAAYLGHAAGSWHHVEHHGDKSGRHRPSGYTEEDIAPGGDHIKLLLLPKPFSAEFREDWETYRTEYWEKENERRTELRRRVRARWKEIARDEGGWLWWTGWRGWKGAKGMEGRGGDIEKTHGHHEKHHARSGSELGKLRPPSMIREGSHSRSSSRSTTPSADLDELQRVVERRARRGSSTAAGSERSRGKLRSSLETSSPYPLGDGGGGGVVGGGGGGAIPVATPSKLSKSTTPPAYNNGGPRTPSLVDAEDTTPSPRAEEAGNASASDAGGGEEQPVSARTRRKTAEPGD